MCGIVGGVTERNLTPILLEGLRRLEYRGYDSSGIALISSEGAIERVRSLGKIRQLNDKIERTEHPFQGQIGIAHTRWATHGVPAEQNAHPHICNNRVAVVHNGIIENFADLKEKQIEQGYRFTSETDTEVVAHCLDSELDNANGDLLKAVQATVEHLDGAYALGVIAIDQPDLLVATRCGSPLVIGVGIGEYFIASDVSALLPVTQQFIFLDEGDVASIRRDQLQIFDKDGEPVERSIVTSSLSSHSVELGEHRHYMHKEIFEQPQAVIDTLQGRITDSSVLVSAFGHRAESIFAEIENIQIIACGTSYHAGMVARYWFEDILGLPCSVEVASEFRYRHPVIRNKTLLVTISQSGETADTLAALREAKQQFPGIASLTICNAPESSLTRESNLVFLTHAGPEIGVASTKAFTTQLVALALLMTAIGQVQKRLTEQREKTIVHGLQKLPTLIQNALKHEETIKQIALSFADKTSALFLGRGTMFPIAMEGALKLKEISYIHAEAYPAGELKHGPLALIDEQIPVVAIAPKDELLEKLKSNLQEVKARGGQMIVFEDEGSCVSSDNDNFHVVKATTNVGRITAPITFNIPLQLLSYHVALIKGTDVDQPRNLAKSVTVE
ncbi:glutamine--fructose-6-phosphate transaminase (isomerizing) [Thiomicrorhabdus xiamenensis]|uniref:Glutamine--fructose-6-phosphate aminotransferase [isomerizing] n=1 Tax=Thiomicrorhabdus xiamenensis TaxID=2739063 RepID=A0A7D4T1E6_9GAMM|nr:glutamine--fructose-6-phosphate transaminase (isomerizing) [Thiomicrorhabdus xiamenensis]QKI89882.1 glutamine--fructose-6-phosphate transaminase (isomerizing) [Thiomicrorhabdus xiamenensis]